MISAAVYTCTVQQYLLFSKADTPLTLRYFLHLGLSQMIQSKQIINMGLEITTLYLITEDAPTVVKLKPLAVKCLSRTPADHDLAKPEIKRPHIAT